MPYRAHPVARPFGAVPEAKASYYIDRSPVALIDPPWNGSRASASVLLKKFLGYKLSFISKFNFTSNLMIQNSKESIIKLITLVVVNNFRAIFKPNDFGAIDIQNYGVQECLG